MGHEGHLVKDLKFKGQADAQGIRGLSGQETIIITAAVTQPAASSIKDRTRQNHNINFLGGNKLSLGDIRLGDLTISRPQFTLRVREQTGGKPPVCR